MTDVPGLARLCNVQKAELPYFLQPVEKIVPQGSPARGSQLMFVLVVVMIPVAIVMIPVALVQLPALSLVIIVRMSPNCSLVRWAVPSSRHPAIV